MNGAQGATRKVLQRAREIVGTGWTQGYLAETANGAVCKPQNEAACRFCALGAVHRAAFELGLEDYSWGFRVLERAIRKLADAVERESDDCIGIGDWNDYAGRVHDDVMDVFESAIASA